MSIRRASRQHRHWLIAVVAVLLCATLMPSLGRAFAAAVGVTWVEVCTAQGVQLKAVNASGGIVDAEIGLADGTHGKFPMGSGDHCPFCQVRHTLPETSLRLPALLFVVEPTRPWKPFLSVRSLLLHVGSRPFTTGPPQSRRSSVLPRT